MRKIIRKRGRGKGQSRRNWNEEGSLRLEENLLLP
jgi:hypothetical protein